MTFLLALLAALLAVALVPPAGAARRRLRVVAASHSPSASGPSSVTRPPPRAPGGPRPPRRRLLVATVAGTGLALAVGGASGLAAGLAVALAAFVVTGRLEPRAVARRREQVEADLPMALDLLAACVTAGTPLPDAVAAVGHAVGGPLGADLDAVVAMLRLGGVPGPAWSGLSEGQLAGVGRVLARVADTGAPLAAALGEAAREQRERARLAAEERARSAGVYAVAPLGLCFLPAFVLVGVVPVVAGLLTAVVS